MSSAEDETFKARVWVPGWLFSVFQLQSLLAMERLDNTILQRNGAKRRLGFGRLKEKMGTGCAFIFDADQGVTDG